jgi:methionyl aminopeptidase
LIHIKTKKEVDYIREACKIVAETLQLLKKNVRPGITTFELDKIAEDYILSRDAKPAFKGQVMPGTFKFPATICASVDDEVVHGIPDGRVLIEGEIISIDCGAVKNRFYGDAALTVAVGEITAEKQRLMDVTEKSLMLGIEQAIERNRLGDVSYAIQKYAEENKFSIVRALTGHGVGKKLHEDPAIPNYGRRATGPVLRNGMTLAIEPMVNYGVYGVEVAENGWTILTEDGMPSAHFEHTVLINGKTPEILTII